jgi:CheY-like chemotaxis protein
MDMTVFIVDDDRDIREMLTEILKDEGYTIATAADGLDALTQLRTQPQPPCLILLDLMMPNMNGWEFCAAQQQDPRLSPIPVVVISARADLDRAVAQIPVAGHLAKPIDIDRLLHIVERHCAEYR